jgi:hypothetical protein
MRWEQIDLKAGLVARRTLEERSPLHASDPRRTDDAATARKLMACAGELDAAFRMDSVQSGVPKGRKFEPAVRNPRRMERLPRALLRPRHENRPS